MTAVIIIAVILCLIAVALFLPVSVLVRFEEDFSVKIKFLGIPLYSSHKPKRKEEKPKEEHKENVQENTGEKAKGIFAKMKEKFGFSGAVKLLFEFLKNALAHIKTLFTHIKFRDVCLNLTVAAGDAATTAIEYGAVCAVAYPFLALLESIADVKYKSVNISSDFEGSKSDFSFFAAVKLNIFSLLVTAFKIYSEYKKFIVRIETNE